MQNWSTILLLDTAAMNEDVSACVPIIRSGGLQEGITRSGKLRGAVREHLEAAFRPETR